MNAYGIQGEGENGEDGFLERVIGVFIGEYPQDRKVYAILYTEAGKEFLCKYHENGDWQMVSYKDEEGETQLEEPAEAPNPLVVAWSLASQAVDDDMDIVI